MENVERRLELIRMMRHEQKENISRIQRREHILYPNRKVYFINDRKVCCKLLKRNFETYFLIYRKGISYFGKISIIR